MSGPAPVAHVEEGHPPEESTTAAPYPSHTPDLDPTVVLPLGTELLEVLVNTDVVTSEEGVPCVNDVTGMTGHPMEKLPESTPGGLDHCFTSPGFGMDITESENMTPQVPPRDPAPLPNGWSAHVSRSSGETYFVNDVTGM
jgi:hypothetical protein